MKYIIAAASILGLTSGSESAGNYCMYSDNTCTVEREISREGQTGGCMTIEAMVASMSSGSDASISCDGGVLAISGSQMSFPNNLKAADIKSGDCIVYGDDTYGSSMSITCNDVAPCFARDTMVELAGGETIPMSDVTAGDYLLPGPTRVVVNQHKNAAHLKSSLLKVDHAQGSISLTPDHVLNVDGSFVAAREAIVGSKLGNSKVSRVTRSSGGIINPLTTTGQIMADGVLASTYPEWIAGYMLGRSTASASSALSFLFPATTQAYYDAHLEQFFQSTFPTLASLATLPAPVIALIFLIADLAVAAGFVAFSLASLKSVVALIAVGAALQSRK